jgi:hypothetical protein
MSKLLQTITLPDANPSEDDALEVRMYDDGQPVLGTTTGDDVELSRDSVVELHRALGAYLERTEPCQDAAPDLEADGYSWNTDDVQPTILAEAESLVYGDRQGDYGHPREDFTRTALLWTGVLLHKLAEGEHITPEDIALCMVQVKVSREVNKPKRDNRVDGAGYLLCLDRLETGR